MNTSCISMPEVGGEISILYQEMLNRMQKDRPLVNYIYARYLSNGVADAMDNVKDSKGNPKYKRNKQGQHSFRDVYEFLDIKQMRKETNSGKPILDAFDLGVVDEDFNYINFSNPEDAYSKALDYNNNHIGRVAYVVQHGNVFNVIIEDLNASNQYKKHLVEAQMLTWDYFKNQTTSYGIDVNALISAAEELLTPINVLDFLDSLYLLQTSSNNVLSVKDIKVFLTIGQNTHQVQTLLSRGWGTLDEIAQRCYDALQNPTSVTSHVLTLINNALNASKSSTLFNPKTIYDNIKNNILPNFETRSEVQKTQEVLNDLELKYNIGNRNINRATKEINTLEDAVAESIITLEREIRNLERKGSTNAAKNLRRTKEFLSQELIGKRYFYGLVQFLDQALNYTQQIRTMLANIPNSGTRLQHIRDTSEVLTKAVSLRDGYYHIVESLINLDSLIVEENMSDADKTTLKQKAIQIKELLDKQQKVIEALQERNAIECMGEYLGEESYLGQSYANIVSIIRNDVGITDYLYSVGKSSNDIIATVGTIIREAQIERDAKLQDISVRIKKATKALYDSKSDSSFMYDSEGRLISEEGIDWNKYEKARRIEFGKLVSLGFKGMALKDAIEAWEFNNTYEKVVDAVSGRTERIPNGSYRLAINPYTRLTTEQKIYFKTMMQIKGEMETLLPQKVQHHFIPPQIRKDWLDVLSEGIKGKLAASDVAKGIWDRMKKWKIREDEEEFISGIRYSDYDNTPLKDIPIFYQTKVGDKDLLHDFSSVIQSLASTALNYDAMTTIQATVETIQDVVDRMVVGAKTSEDKPIIDIVSSSDRVKALSNSVKQIAVQMFAKKAAGSKTKEMLDAYVEMQMFNQKYKGSKKLNKWMNMLIGYNSVTRLALNLTGATSNIIQGDLQMIIEAGGGKYYNLWHLMKAHARMFGNVTVGTFGKFWDILSGSRSNIDTLLCEFFDAFSDNYADKSRERYYKNPFRRLFGDINAMSVYSMGESFIRALSMYAILYKEKVLLNGKKVSLLEAFDKTTKKDGFSDLKLKDNVTKLDGTALTLDDDYFKDIKHKIKGASDDCFGSMNNEDKGIIHQHFLGRLAMNFRQWMVGHYSRRFRTKHWDNDKQRYVEGYWVTVGRTLWSLRKGYANFLNEYEALHPDLKEDAKYNYKKAATEFLVWLGLLVFNFGFGDEDDDETWMQRWATLLLKRTFSEFSAGLPIGLLTETYRISQNPLPPLVSVTGLIYPITGIIQKDLISRDDFGDITWTKIESGRYSGWNKYLRNLLWYTVPFYKQIDQLAHLTEEDSLYQVYERQLK